MKLFLIDFSTPILVEVAKELAKKGVNITYWTGRMNRFYYKLDKSLFFNTIFHDNLEATQGKPAKELCDVFFPPPDTEFLKELLECESIVLTMMTRLDFSNIPLIKKKHFYYKYVQYWEGVLEKYKPNMIVFRSVPHTSYNFVLYALAKKRGIKTLMFDAACFDDRLMVLDDYHTVSQELKDAYDRIKDEKFGLDKLEDNRRFYIEKLRKQKSDATSENRKKKIEEMKKPLKIFPSFKKIKKHLLNGNFFSVARYHLFSVLNMTTKPIFTIDEHDKNDYSNVYHKKRIGKVTEKYRKEYENLQRAPDLDKKFIYLPLHYQPECNTSPMADFYVDQILMVKTLAAALPDYWELYVKENIIQWDQGNPQPHLYRYNDYYKEMANIPNVRLIPAEMSSFDLIEKAQAVATATGTIGWEALNRGKIVLFFGSPWYMYCDGALRVSGVESCKKAIEKVQSGKKPDLQRVLNYFIAFEETTLHANHVMYKQKGSKLSIEHSVDNISSAIYSKLFL